MLEEPCVVLVGTIRKDGTPRISPVEPYFHEGDLWLPMLWQSHKAADLVRDPRVLLHSIVTSKDGADGEFKVRGQAVAVSDSARIARLTDAVEAISGWRMVEAYVHVFTVDIESAVFIRYEDGDQRVLLWPQNREFIRRELTPTSVGEPEEVTSPQR